MLFCMEVFYFISTFMIRCKVDIIYMQYKIVKWRRETKTKSPEMKRIGKEIERYFKIIIDLFQNSK